MNKIMTSKELVTTAIKDLRNNTKILKFDKTKPAEVEINKFFYKGKCIDRIMVVLRANGCEHYKKTGGCSMCSHYNGTPINDEVTYFDYVKQWDSIINGEFLEDKDALFDINNYPVLCLYNLGSLLNSNEIDVESIKYIFSSLNKYKGIKKVIIESRAEYVTDEILKVIKSVFENELEIGIGVESTNYIIRELCHHKGIESLEEIKESIKIIHNNNCKALAYINFKPIFITEKEAIDDAIKTGIDCFNYGFDAISIEPTSLQENSLSNHLYNLGCYRVPWLWSLTEIVQNIINVNNGKTLDIRLGGYFDEEVLSGSQGIGYLENNEIFPHMTSSNCTSCTNMFIGKIKSYNITYNENILNHDYICPNCYELWKKSKNIKDSRSIEQRILDILGE